MVNTFLPTCSRAGVESTDPGGPWICAHVPMEVWGTSFQPRSFCPPFPLSPLPLELYPDLAQLCSGPGSPQGWDQVVCQHIGRLPVSVPAALNCQLTWLFPAVYVKGLPAHDLRLHSEPGGRAPGGRASPWLSPLEVALGGRCAAATAAGGHRPVGDGTLRHTQAALGALGGALRCGESLRAPCRRRRPAQSGADGPGVLSASLRLVSLPFRVHLRQVSQRARTRHRKRGPAPALHPGTAAQRGFCSPSKARWDSSLN